MELAPQLNYPDSVDSSPHSITNDSWDEPNSFNLLPSAKIRLMCSYGGHIVPRPHDKSLCYLGGHTRIISFDRSTTNLSCLSSTLSSSLLQPGPFTLKYQLPNEDLDSLISISTDEDLDNMIDEYDRATTASSGVPNRPTRVRLFIFPSKPDTVSAPSSIGSDTKSESWFVDALNGADVSVTRGMSADVNSLLGLDVSGDVDRNVGKNGTAAAPDVQSVPDSPIVENTPSLFGSGSSAPSVSRFGADDGVGRFPDMPIGLEEQFARMGIGVGVGNKQGESFLPHSGFSPKQAAAGGISPSEAERVEHGSPAARNLKSPPVTPIHSQQKESTLDFPTETFGRESNPGAAVSRPKPQFYQDPPAGGPIQDRVSASATVNPVTDPRREFSNRNYQIPVQFQDPGFMSSPQQEQQQQQQQFFHAMGPQYIQHPATGQLMPISSYYQMHSMQQNPQQQQQIDQQYSMYYMPVRQNQAYNLAFQSNLGDAHSIQSRKPAGQFSNPATIPTASVYPPRPEPPQRTAAGASQQLIHDQYQQHQQQQHDQYQQHQQHQQQQHDQYQQHQQQQQQYMGYQQLHNPLPPSQVAASNFMYEFADPSLSQMYYNQPAAAAMAQYQTVNSETLRPTQLAEAKQSGTSQLL